MSKSSVVIIGGGPSGLMAAETLSARGYGVAVYDHKPSLARKFLMAGRGGLNITHSESIEKFAARYGAASSLLTPHLNNFAPSDMIKWCENLGEPTFVGTSGRVFPKSFKASPLLRAWLQRLEAQGVTFHLNMRWHGWDSNKLVFTDSKNAQCLVTTDATLLALGGASWPRLGSDGGWVPLLKAMDIAVDDLQPANCGFIINWSDIFRNKYVGQPLKSVTLSFADQSVAGDMMITDYGIEGGPVYALSAALRDSITQNGPAALHIDLKPDLDVQKLANKLQQRGGAQSLTNSLRKLGLSAVTIGLLMEQPDRQQLGTYPAMQLASRIKALPLTLTAPAAIDRAISTAGGIQLNELDDNLMLVKKPGVFAAGEILDWEAPTGGYLLQACFATGIAAANGIIRYLR